MNHSIKVLLVEDDAADAELLVRELCRAGFAPAWQRVETEEAFLVSLEGGYDLVLLDYTMPQFDGLRALELMKERGLDIPCLLVSGSVGEEVAVTAMKHGASDYLLKDRLARLGPAVRQALEQGRLRRERLAAIETLRESEERFRQVTENIHDVFWLTDLVHGQVLYVSPAYEQIWGRPCAELYASAKSWLDAIHPDDRPGVLDVTEVDASNGSYTQEYRIVRPDGAIRWIQDCAFPVANPTGRFCRVVGIARDITERKDAGERLREQAEMLDRAHEAILVRDFQTRRITSWNRGAERLYGWSADEARGRDVGELIFADQSQPNEIAGHLIDTDDWHGELRHRSRHGAELIISSHATLLRDARGEPKAILSINIDITQQKRLEAQLLRAQRLESVGALASGLAHDLNNTLAPILMCAPLLRSDLGKDRTETIISMVEASAQRAAEIVRQVLTFSRGSEQERRPVPIHHLTAEMVKVAKATFPKSIAVEESHAAGLWEVTADPTQLYQVLMNLFVNARDAMPAGGTLRVSAKNITVDESYASMMREARPGCYVVVEVSDTGTGMPATLLDKIFDPFFTTKPEGKGTGLGLASVMSIVKSHSGFISVQSKPGEGSSFRVFLPAGLEALAAATASPPAAIPPGAGECILVVDDEASVRAMAAIVLESHGYRVLTAADGTEAVAVYAQKRGDISVVLTDILMPFMDGIGLVRALRKIHPEVKIIASTGQAEQSRLAELKALTVTALLSKPYSGHALVSALDAILRPRGPRA